MEFKEIVKTHERMCKMYHLNKDCAGCKINDYDDSCHDVPFLYADEYEKIIEEWLKDNPPVTRKNILATYYPDRPWRKYLYLCDHIICNRSIPCNDCAWWEEEVSQED